MQCPDFEVRLCDLLDGTLDAAPRQQMEQHASECRLCAALLADSRAVSRFLERVEPVEAPRELVTNILYRTQQSRAGWVKAAGGLGSWLHGKLQLLLQPRFAMGMAMTILSLSMLYRVAGVKDRHLQVADLNPVNIWRGIDQRATRLWDRGVKSYQNIRFIYEIVEQFRALQAEEPQQGEQAAPEKESPWRPKKMEPVPQQRGARDQEKEARK